jgi:hypothetical protein
VSLQYLTLGTELTSSSIILQLHKVLYWLDFVAFLPLYLLLHATVNVIYNFCSDELNRPSLVGQRFLNLCDTLHDNIYLSGVMDSSDSQNSQRSMP